MFCSRNQLRTCQKVDKDFSKQTWTSRIIQTLKINCLIVEVEEFKFDLRRDVAPFFSMSIRGNANHLGKCKIGFPISFVQIFEMFL